MRLHRREGRRDKGGGGRGNQCCQSFGFYPNSTDFEGLVLCLFYAYSDFSDGFSVG